MDDFVVTIKKRPINDFSDEEDLAELGPSNQEIMNEIQAVKARLSRIESLLELLVTNNNLEEFTETSADNKIELDYDSNFIEESDEPINEEELIDDELNIERVHLEYSMESKTEETIGRVFQDGLNFPLKSTQEIKELEKSMVEVEGFQQKVKNYLQSLKNSVKVQSFSYGLSLIANDRALYNINWNGHKLYGKISMKSMVLFSNLLFGKYLIIIYNID